MEFGDIELLNKYIVDFILFLYYNSCCVRIDENVDDMVEGNIFIFVKNLYFLYS